MFALGGLVWLIMTIRFSRRTVPTIATVVGHLGDDREDSLPQSLLPPIVEFADEQGEVHRVVITDRDRAFGTGTVVGARIAVRYHRDNPGEVRRPSVIAMWLAPLMFLGIGSVSVVIGVLVWVLEVPIR